MVASNSCFAIYPEFFARLENHLGPYLAPKDGALRPDTLTFRQKNGWPDQPGWPLHNSQAINISYHNVECGASSLRNINVFTSAMEIGTILSLSLSHTHTHTHTYTHTHTHIYIYKYINIRIHFFVNSFICIELRDFYRARCATKTRGCVYFLARCSR